jgi:hypothetical protein
VSTPFSGYTAFYDIMVELRDAVILALRDNGVSFARAGIVPGAIAWDGCAQCGQLALAIIRQFLTADDFPTEITTTTGLTGEFITADMVVQAISCVPTISDSGAPPSILELDRSAKTEAVQALVILCTVDQTLKTMKAHARISDYMIRQQVVVGPEGACVGSELSFAVALG